MKLFEVNFQKTPPIKKVLEKLQLVTGLKLQTGKIENNTVLIFVNSNARIQLEKSANGYKILCLSKIHYYLLYSCVFVLEELGGKSIANYNVKWKGKRWDQKKWYYFFMKL